MNFYLILILQKYTNKMYLCDPAVQENGGTKMYGSHHQGTAVLESGVYYVPKLARVK